MRIVYDTAVLVAADRDDRDAWLQHRRWLERGYLPVVTSPVVAQASRSPRQALLHRLLASCDLVTFAASDAHRVGALLGRADRSDVVDGHVVVIAGDDDAIIVTGDVEDLEALAAHVPRRPVVAAL